MIDLNEVLTFSEAAEKWGLSDGNTLRKAVERNKFEAHEIRKSGNVWLITYEAMIRVFGVPGNVEFTITYADIIKIVTHCLKQNANFRKEIRTIYIQAMVKLNEGGQVALIESHKHPNVIVRIFTNQEELEAWFHYFEIRLEKRRR